MTDTVCFPVTEVISIDAMASVDTVVWWCRLCGDEATAASRSAAHSDAVAHLTTEHHATIGIAPNKLRPGQTKHQIELVDLPAVVKAPALVCIFRSNLHVGTDRPPGAGSRRRQCPTGGRPSPRPAENR